MSSSNPNVRVRISDGQGELEIVDSRFNVIAEGFGEVTSNPLLPGIYKARARAGDARDEQIFAVTKDSRQVEVTFPALKFASPIPLDGTSTTHEYHQGPVGKSLYNPPIDIGAGTGAAILICLRDPWTKFGSSSQPIADYSRAFDGFRLRDSDGSILADFDGRLLPNSWGIVVASFSVEPGTYIFSYKGAQDETRSVPVHAVRDWQTQMFVSVSVRARSTSDLGLPDLSDRAVLMTRLGEQFYANERHVRLTEIARVALAGGTQGISESDLAELLHGKFENPVLGLFAAHLLLRRDRPLKQLRAVLQNIAKLLGDDFPDVVALRCEVNRRGRNFGPTVSVKEPPLLRASWDLLATNAEGIAPGSFAARVAQVLSPGGIWTDWRADDGILAPQVDSLRDLRRKGFGGFWSRIVSGLEGSALRDSALAFDERLSRESEKANSAHKVEDALERTLRVAQSWALDSKPESRQLRLQVLPSLSQFQKRLLLVMQTVGRQLANGDQFTSTDLRGILELSGLPLARLAGEVDILALKLRNTGYLLSAAREERPAEPRRQAHDST